MRFAQVEFGQLLDQFASDDKVTIALLLITVDFILGICAAVKLRTFKVSYLGAFARDDVLGKLVPWFVLYSAGKVAGDEDLVISGLDFGDVANAVYVVIVAAWVGSILSSVRQLGLSGGDKDQEARGVHSGHLSTVLGPENPAPVP